MQVTLAGLADFASTSADGKLNVLGLFDEITPDSDFPYRWPRLYLVVSFALSPDEVMAAHPIQVILRDWEDNAVLTVTKKLSQNLNHKCIDRFLGRFVWFLQKHREGPHGETRDARSLSEDSFLETKHATQ